LARNSTQERIKRLNTHLKRENPVLAGCVQSFQRLDKIARKLGLQTAEDSYATQVSWWPVISVLGTFSAGKSTFMNQYVGQNLQRTGNQAVDDKFTVICYGQGDSGASLPGLALDSDPRFPFYQISHSIEQVAEGVAATHRATTTIDWAAGSPALVNDVAATARLRAAAERVVGVDHVHENALMMGGDDMALWLQRAPGCYLFVGANGGEDTSWPHHHPRFDLDEAALPLAVELFAEGIVDLLTAPDPLG
jgi:hypothetical protein